MGTQSYLKTPGVHSIPGEPFRFYVESRTDAKARYLVDLEAWAWNGQCGCPDFSYHKLPLLKMGAFPSQVLQCWHTNRARFYAFREMGRSIADQYYRLVRAREGQPQPEPGPSKEARQVGGRNVRNYQLKQ